MESHGTNSIWFLNVFLAVNWYKVGYLTNNHLDFIVTILVFVYNIDLLLHISNVKKKVLNLEKYYMSISADRKKSSKSFLEIIIVYKLGGIINSVINWQNFGSALNTLITLLWVQKKKKQYYLQIKNTNNNRFLRVISINFSLRTK